MERAQGEYGETKRLLAFLDRHSLLLAVCLIVVAALRIVSTYSQIGITYDEPAHIACGMQFLAQHVYRYEAQHPPLARVMCALGPYLAGLHPAGQENMTNEGTAIFYEDGQVARNLVLDRLGILPFFILGCLVVYFWGKRYFGGRVGVLATALFTTTPVVLAHAGLGTTDMALAACMGAAFLCLLIWVEKPTLNRGLLLGVATGTAILTKFSALVFVPASAGAALLLYLVRAWPGWRGMYALARERAASFGAAAFTACVVIHAGYLFSFGEEPGWGVWLPAPEFFQGIREVIEHNDSGHPAFFLGHLSLTGWWYYFPVMLLFKTPVGFLLLCGFGLYVCWERRERLANGYSLALIAGVLLPSMAGHIDIGTRHILPVYLGFSVLGAVAMERLVQLGGSRGTRWAGALVCAALAADVLVSGALHHPDYVSYVNELLRKPEDLFVDSDLDWGQGTPMVARYLNGMHTSEVTCSFWYLTAEQLRIWPGLNVKPLDFQRQAEGWTAVSPTYWRLIGFVTHADQVKAAWFAKREPTKRIGGMLLYYVTPQRADAK
jgi:4-amino-4-deoxy-L-arabinose transferase-like glycosyltransferase